MTQTDTLTFWDNERGREEHFDFASLDLPPEIEDAFKRAFAVLTGAYRATSRYQAWGHLRQFAAFLRRRPGGAQRAIADPRLLLRYKKQLIATKMVRPAGRFNFVRRLLRWLADNEESWHSAVVVSGISMTNSASSTRASEVSPELLRKIVSLCKKQVDRAMEHIAVRRCLERGETVVCSELSAVDLKTLRRIIALEAQGCYGHQHVKKDNRDRAAGVVSLSRLAPYRALTVRTALPYYLLLIINTCGNPYGLAHIEIDCLQPHPTDPLKRRLHWSKHRSTREQAYDVMADGKYSAARCVRDLLELTQPIRSLAVPIDARKLIIARRGGVATRISHAGFRVALRSFRSDHSLPHFTFAGLRKGAAAAVDQYLRSARQVKKVLQHKSARTTRIYLQARRSVDRRYETVLRFQGEMVDLATSPHGARATAPVEAAYETVSGLRCRDHLAGAAAGSIVGQACLQWLQCCQCPNAILIRDDPSIVARIVRAAQSLKERELSAANSTDGTQHFEATYRPTLHVIENQILPRITRRVREKAEEIAATLPPVPLME